ncbi:unnamed protein product [Rhizoctonia solani]|uniref:Fungal-type protein kinase domain-containing protein n=1 Tax=Rhizoctonia solani TaxID=456999 RepID=A0A8H3BIV2_9AGAM|nr:unnamed protein product [Rhizoctonia solani]
MPSNSRAHQSSKEPQYQRIPQSTIFLDNIIEQQFKDSIFYDPNFFKNFLSFVPSPGDIVRLCLRYDWYLRVHDGWNFPDEVKGKQCLHQPVLHLLNTIKSATDVVLSSPGHARPFPVPDLADASALQYKKYHIPLNPETPDLTLPCEEAQYFEDWSTRDLAHALPEKIMLHLKPDIILFRGKWQHWSNIRFIVEVTENPGYLAPGIKQLACYAHAVFAHQPWRRHFYSLLICGKKASFVRFDRAGILYSSFLDIAKNPAFVIALAGLLSLDTIDQGINPAFQFGADGVYIELLECMLGQDAPTGGPDVRKVTKTTRFRILQEICDPASSHRVTGPGTTILRIREQFPPEREGEGVNSSGGAESSFDGSHRPAQNRPPVEYILKLTWRLDNGRLEGQALEEAEGVFGVPQHVSHGDIVMPGRCVCSLLAGAPVLQAQCTTCVDRTPSLRGLQVCSNFNDLSANIRLVNGEGPRGTLAVPTSARSNRIYSYVLLSSFGKLMEHAESPEIYVNAMMDAMLGCWGLYNLGIIHRDISPLNLLILTEEQQFTHTRWEEADHQIQDPVLADSEHRLRQTLQIMRPRKPIGILIDLSTHERLGHRKAPLNPELVGEHRALPHKLSVAKKRQGDSGDTVATTSTKARRTRWAELPTLTADGPQPPFDYLIYGNEPFHSIRITRMVSTPRLKYQHHFYDDLEAFFWVMFWTTISHVDPGKERSADAATFLTKFYHADPRCLHIAWKKRILDDCRMHAGIDTLAILDACKNSWASNRPLRVAIASFGCYIGIIREEEGVAPPAEVFQAVITTLDGVLKTEK